MGKIAFMFTGQGAQYPGMGLDLYKSCDAARGIFDAGERLFPGILSTCFESTAQELTLTSNAQPALFLHALAAATALRERGVSADMCAGFSLGEMTALAYAGVLSFEDAFRLVLLRGTEMDKCSKAVPGGMAAVLRLAPEKVEELCAAADGAFPVNYNCPGQIVCACRSDVLDGFCDAVKAAGGRCVRLAVSGAFHTPYMQGCADALADFLGGVKINAPAVPLYSDVTAAPYPVSGSDIAPLICAQCKSSVRWEQLLHAMSEAGADTFVELGAGTTLAGLCKKTLGDVSIFSVGDAGALDAAAAIKQ